MKPLAIRYAPERATTIPGRQKIAKEIISFIEGYNSAKKKAILLHGPSGVGKTSLIHAVAKELDYELFELNASDKRNKGAIEEIVAPVLQTHSFFGPNKIVLLDEIDGLSGRDDRGGAAILAKLIATSKFPLILTANDGYADKLKPIRKIAKVIDFEPLQINDIVQILQAICQKEDISVEENTLKKIIAKNQGDIRGSINDVELATSLVDGKKTIAEDSILELSDRMKQESVEYALTRIFKTMDHEVALSAFDNTSADYNDWFSWVDYNMPKEYTGIVDKAKAYGAISKADVFMGRIRKQQYWRLLVYVKELLTAGVALSKKEPYKKPASYKQSSRGLTIWMTRNQVAKKRSIATKLADMTHTSTKQVMNNWYTYVPILYQTRVQESLDLDETEIAWLKKNKATS